MYQGLYTFETKEECEESLAKRESISTIERKGKLSSMLASIQTIIDSLLKRLQELKK